jgi:transportin-1
MLALGALSTGCLVEMGQYLPQLFPFLIQNLADPTPEMSSIACWVLSRYCSWIFEDKQVQMEGASDRYFIQLLEALLGILLDPRPKVQTACCSALCTLIEVAGPDPIIPFLPQLLSYIEQAFSIYGIKSSLILVDTIGTVADIVGDALSDNTLVPLYFPKLIEKFGELEDDDMRLFPILECLTSVVAASGLECQPYAHGLYFRCLRIIGNTMSANAIADAKIVQNGGDLNDYTNGIKNSKSMGSLEGQMQEGEECLDGMYI